MYKKANHLLVSQDTGWSHMHGKVFLAHEWETYVLEGSLQYGPLVFMVGLQILFLALLLSPPKIKY